MGKIGYARVSTEDQNLDSQISDLEKYGCEIVFSEKISGKTSNRPEFNRMREYLRKGDILVCWKIDRLGRNTRDLIYLVEELERKGITIISLSDGINSGSPLGKAFVQISAIFAEIERSYSSERTRAGLEAARRRGMTLGRPPGPSTKELKFLRTVTVLFNQKISVSKISVITGLSRATVYRYLQKYMGNQIVKEE